VVAYACSPSTWRLLLCDTNKYLKKKKKKKKKSKRGRELTVVGKAAGLRPLAMLYLQPKE
jgi:hypothetical protein